MADDPYSDKWQQEKEKYTEDLAASRRARNEDLEQNELAINNIPLLDNPIDEGTQIIMDDLVNRTEGKEAVALEIKAIQEQVMQTAETPEVEAVIKSNIQKREKVISTKPKAASGVQAIRNLARRTAEHPENLLSEKELTERDERANSIEGTRRHR